MPIALFFVLGIVFFDKAFRRTARRSWAWGRSGGEVALSRRSYAIIGLTFFTIAFIIRRVPEPGWIAVAAIGVCFVLVIATGSADTHAYRKRLSASDSRAVARDRSDDPE